MENVLGSKVKMPVSVVPLFISPALVASLQAGKHTRVLPDFSLLRKGRWKVAATFLLYQLERVTLANAHMQIRRI